MDKEDQRQHHDSIKPLQEPPSAMTQNSSNSIQIVVPRIDILEEILRQPVVVDDADDREAYEASAVQQQLYYYRSHVLVNRTNIASGTQKIIRECLSEEEVELAACTSYAYWAWTKLSSSSATASTYRHTMATKEVRRHYLGEDRVFDTAVEKLKSCLAWRKVSRMRLVVVVHQWNTRRKDV